MAELIGTREVSGMRKALLVEDNEINAEIAKLQLSSMGFDVDWVENGAVAVDCFTASEEGHYQLVVMDLMMPVMDGIEATAAIRHLERSDATKVPIIAVTATAFSEDREQAINSGVTSFVTKPYNKQALREIIDGLFVEGDRIVL